MTFVFLSRLERPTPDRHWPSQDTYTTEIVYDSDLVRDYESTTHAGRTETHIDVSTPPAYSRNYDRVRPGQYPSMPSTSQATLTPVPSSNYDRISSIVAPPAHYVDRRPPQREEMVSEEYLVEVEQRHTGRLSPQSQHQTSRFGVPSYREGSSEEEVSDPYVTVGDGSYQGQTTIVDEARRGSSTGRSPSDWRSKLKQVYTPTSDDDAFDQVEKNKLFLRVHFLVKSVRARSFEFFLLFPSSSPLSISVTQFGKQSSGNYTAQRVSIVPTNLQQRFKEVNVKIPAREKTSVDQPPLKPSPPLRHAVKEVLVCVSRGASPEKQLQQQIYHLRSSSSSDEGDQERNRWVHGDVSAEPDRFDDLFSTVLHVCMRCPQH